MRSFDTSSMWPISFPIVAVYCQILSLKVLTRHSETPVFDVSTPYVLVKRSKSSRLKPLESTFLQIITFSPSISLLGSHQRLSATVMPAVFSPFVSTCTLELANTKNDGLTLV